PQQDETSGTEPLEAAPAADAETEKLSEDIRRELAEALGSGLDGITVVPSRSGVLISIMDEMKSAMFAIGSAVPQQELVLAMEKIGRTLAQHEGAVTINGHTDGRPFQGNSYDNWQLSSARAQAAYYM